MTSWGVQWAQASARISGQLIVKHRISRAKALQSTQTAACFPRATAAVGWHERLSQDVRLDACFSGPGRNHSAFQHQAPIGGYYGATIENLNRTNYSTTVNRSLPRHRFTGLPALPQECRMHFRCTWAHAAMRLQQGLPASADASHRGHRRLG